MRYTFAVFAVSLVVVAVAARVWRWRPPAGTHRYTTGSNPAFLARRAFAEEVFGSPTDGRRRRFHFTRR